MSSPTNSAQNVWTTNPGEDFLQLNNPTLASPVSGIDSTGSPFGNLSVFQQTQVSISSAQLLAMGTTPVTIIPAPGAGKAVIPFLYLFESLPGSTPYTFSNVNLGFILYPQASTSGPYLINLGQLAIASGLADGSGLDGTKPALSSGEALWIVGTQVGLAAIENTPWVLQTGISNGEEITFTPITNGNGTAKVTVVYYTVTL
jgi:hypothetical protein